MRRISIIAGLALLTMIVPLGAADLEGRGAAADSMASGVDYAALQILNRQGRAAANRGEFRTALMAADAMLAEDPMYADALVLRGVVSRETGQQRTAYDHYDAALQLEPDHLMAQSLLGQLFLDIGRVDRARSFLVTLDRLCPFGCGPAHALRQAIVDFEQGDWVAPGVLAAASAELKPNQTQETQADPDKTKE